MMETQPINQHSIRKLFGAKKYFYKNIQNKFKFIVGKLIHRIIHSWELLVFNKILQNKYKSQAGTQRLNHINKNKNKIIIYWKLYLEEKT